MNSTTYLTLPAMLEAIEEDTQALGFEMASDKGKPWTPSLYVR